MTRSPSVPLAPRDAAQHSLAYTKLISSSGSKVKPADERQYR